MSEQKATTYIEQDGEVVFEHRSTGINRDEIGAAKLAFSVWRLSGMQGYTVGKKITARVEWDEPAHSGESQETP